MSIFIPYLERMRWMDLNRIGIIDYDAGNTQSVIHALEYLGMDVLLSGDSGELMRCDRIIFPGVGAYYDAMQKLKAAGLVETVYKIAESGTPFLGICLGMQMLFERSAEVIGCPDDSARTVPGLGVLRGSIIKFEGIAPLKIPHIGWNSVHFTNPDSRLFAGIPQDSFFYFVHSYYLMAENRNDVAGRTVYGTEFDCAVEAGNVFGCQFHPEKSGEAGLQVLENFCRL